MRILGVIFVLALASACLGAEMAVASKQEVKAVAEETPTAMPGASEQKKQKRGILENDEAVVIPAEDTIAIEADTPVVPLVPGIPELPAVPIIPAAPALPETPALPAAPFVPSAQIPFTPIAAPFPGRYISSYPLFRAPKSFRTPIPAPRVLGYHVLAPLPPTKITVHNTYAVPYTKPYAVHVDKPVAVPVVHRVPVHVDKPYAAPYARPYAVPVDKPVPVPVDRPYAVPYIQKVPVPVYKDYVYPVAKPVPVEVPVATETEVEVQPAVTLYKAHKY